MAKAKIKYMIRDDGVIYIWTPVLAVKKGFRPYDPEKEEPKTEEKEEVKGEVKEEGKDVTSAMDLLDKRMRETLTPNPVKKEKTVSNKKVAGRPRTKK